MAIRTMIPHEEAKRLNFENVEIVHDYPGHEAGLTRHSPRCPHYSVETGGREIGPGYADCVGWNDERAEEIVPENTPGASCVWGTDKAGKFGRRAGHCEGPFDPLYMHTTHVGLVLDADGEINGRDDSDFYALVWNAEKGAAERVFYASTRGWTYPNSARADATPEVRAAFEAWQARCRVEAAERRDAERAAQEKAAAEKAAKLAADKAAASREVAESGFKKGDAVQVTRGVHKGKAGRIFWIGANKSARVGVEFAGGAREFVNLGQIARG